VAFHVRESAGLPTTEPVDKELQDRVASFKSAVEREVLTRHH